MGKARAFMRIAYALAVLGSLGVGVDQAVARPQPADDHARACTQASCWDRCIRMGESGGECIKGGLCGCF